MAARTTYDTGPRQDPSSVTPLHQNGLDYQDVPPYSSSGPSRKQIEHAHLTAVPCDLDRNFLPPGSTRQERTQRSNADWSPFDDQTQFMIADLLYRRVEMSASNIDLLMKLWLASLEDSGLDTSEPFECHQDLYAKIDSSPLGDVPWQCFITGFSEDLHMPVDAPSWKQTSYEVWYRDPDLAISAMLDNPDFEGHFDVRPYMELDEHSQHRWGVTLSGAFCAACMGCTEGDGMSQPKGANPLRLLSGDRAQLLCRKCTEHTGALGDGKGVQREGYTPIARGNGGPCRDLKDAKEGEKASDVLGSKISRLKAQEVKSRVVQTVYREQGQSPYPPIADKMSNIVHDKDKPYQKHNHVGQPHRSHISVGGFPPGSGVNGEITGPTGVRGQGSHGPKSHGQGSHGQGSHGQGSHGQESHDWQRVKYKPKLKIRLAGTVSEILWVSATGTGHQGGVLGTQATGIRQGPKAVSQGHQVKGPRHKAIGIWVLGPKWSRDGGIGEWTVKCGTRGGCSDEIFASNADAFGAMYCPIILGCDKTTVSVATGHVEYHPLYLSIGNIHNTIRRAHRNAVVPIAFLAIPKSDRRYDDDPEFRKFKCQLYHASLSAILRMLLPGMTKPAIRRCPDGHYSSRLVSKPFTNDFPHADIHAMLSPDLLHQVIKGMFKDHLVTWVGEYLLREHGESKSHKILDEIDRQCITESLLLFQHSQAFAAFLKVVTSSSGPVMTQRH
ncbi:hypothetical protein B0F90DRAFT_1672605 [Multifurca ochricompacta]|uniref:Uncharacterized protein n=1 Tax=Multifurca ochricompacta TaxID=376703 RepID=A0AAD4LT89_9AGAM|nr:hypothetical protein B0F90DRAFT_1672605 [Multifurca ochricompacta]